MVTLRDISSVALIALIAAPVLFVSIQEGSAQVRQSTNYRIESDSINFGGGLSTSSSYTIESTAGEVGTGDVSSASYALKAGYQQMTTRYIAMSTLTGVTMTPSLVGISGGTSNGSTTVTVTTDSAAGYELSIAALNSPAMQKGVDSIADYAPGGTPTYAFTVGESDAVFGYSPSGVDVVQRFKDDGLSACDTGSAETALACWDGLDTVDEVVARASLSNHPNGATTTIYFRVGIGGSVVQPAGTYVATTTLTAIAL